MKSLVFALLFFIALPTGSAWAETFEQSIERGKSAFEGGNYKVAIDAFSAAYKTRPTASLLYNIGRSYDAVGDLENAELYYERFINAPGITQESRADAVGRLKTVRDIQQMKVDDKKREEDAKTVAAEKDSSVAKMPKEESVDSSVSPVTWVLLGLGAASIGGGVVTGILSQSKFDDMETLGYPDSVASKDVENVASARDSGQTLKISSIALMGGGALLVAGGVATYFLTKTDSDASGAVWNIQPTLARTSAGLQLSGKW